MINFKLPLPLLIAALSAGMVACSSDNNPADITDLVSVDFAAKVNGADATCDQTYTGVGTGPNNFKLTDFRLFVHSVFFKDTAGNEYPVELVQDGVWQLDNLALLDFEDGCVSGTAETNNSVTGTVTRAADAELELDQVQVCFTVGVPESLNHSDSSSSLTPSPLNDSTMQWNWLAGYKYIRVDGIGDPGGADNGFNIHLGAQGCPASSSGTAAPPVASCIYQNTFAICIDGFNPATNRIAVDVGTVLAGNDISVNAASTAKGCMSFVGDEDCVEVMPRLGLDYSYGNALGSSSYAGGQAMFTRE